MKLKLSITVYPELKGKALTTGTFQADSHSIDGELSIPDNRQDCGETSKAAIGHLRSLPVGWTHDFIRSI